MRSATVFNHRSRFDIPHRTVLEICRLEQRRSLGFYDANVSSAPSKIPYGGISPIRLQTIIPLNIFHFPVCIEHIYNTQFPSVFQFCIWQLFLCVELIVQSPFAPSLLQRLLCYYKLIRQSYSPAEFHFLFISAALVY